MAKNDACVAALGESVNNLTATEMSLRTAMQAASTDMDTSVENLAKLMQFIREIEVKQRELKTFMASLTATAPA